MASFAMHAKLPGPKKKKIISSSYANTFGETNFHTRRKKEREKERPKVGNNNGHLCIANTTSGGTHKPPGPKDI